MASPCGPFSLQAPQRLPVDLVLAACYFAHHGQLRMIVATFGTCCYFGIIVMTFATLRFCFIMDPQVAVDETLRGCASNIGVYEEHMSSPRGVALQS